ncbi:MAG: AMP-binding protein [Caldilineales bacterium]|nr:AMP-binding protein [Caldilineales bacterium]
MSADLLHRLQETVRHAYANAPALRRHLDQAGLSPADIGQIADLDRIPILSKDRVIQMQQADPPFGGLLAVPRSEVKHIFLSPGPLYEPDGGEENTWVAVAVDSLRRCGFRPGDVVLNTLSYHLVPAGLLLDRALVAVGCTVLPGGVGNSDLQVKMMKDLGATAYTGAPSFLLMLLQKAEEMGLDVRTDLGLRTALVTAEPLPPSLYQTLTQTYGLRVANGYATAELGLLALSLDGGRAMQLLPEPVIQVVDPETGKSVGPGEAGEVVVTQFDRAYPLIRFGTGDMAILLDPRPGQSEQQERAIILVGRSGEAVKVRGMFVHPNQLRAAVAQVLPAQAVQGMITRPDVRDHFQVRIVAAAPPADEAATVTQIKEAVQAICRVRADEVLFVEMLPQGAAGMVDARVWE